MLNNVTMMGRLTRQPEIRRTQQGVAVTNFGLAVQRDYSDMGNVLTDFFEVVAWRTTAEFASKYLKKGQLVTISGRLQNSEWKDKDGTKKTRTEIQADRIYFADAKKPDGKEKEPYREPEPSDFEELEDEDWELPF